MKIIDSKNTVINSGMSLYMLNDINIVNINKILKTLEKYSDFTIEDTWKCFKYSNNNINKIEIDFWYEKEFNLESDSDLLIDFILRLSINEKELKDKHIIKVENMLNRLLNKVENMVYDFV